MNAVKLHPALKNYLWGGSKLKTQWGKNSDWNIVAESWELSCHKDGMSIVGSGGYSGKTLPEYLEVLGDCALGKNCEQFEDFPILIKLLDAQSNLSVQVHPDDEYSLKNEGQYGKTEVWYIADCDEGAFIYYGFVRDVTPEEYKKHIEAGTLTEILNKVLVKKGDVYFIKAGTIHAVGAGCTIAEIQQNSNVTYRVDDYGRVDANGKTRELHIEQAIAVTELTRPPIIKRTGNQIARCKYFSVEKHEVKGITTFNADEKSFHSVLCAEGEGEIRIGKDTLTFTKGESIFIPANTGSYDIYGDFTILLTTVPGASYRIGVDLGGTNIAVGIVDEDYKIVAKHSIPTGSERHYSEVVSDMARAVEAALTKAGVKPEQCVSVGIGSPGTCDTENGVVAYANNLKWDDVPIVDEFRKHIDLPTSISNDANCAALGEALAGAAVGCDNAVMLTLGTGVGGGIIIGGEIYAGGYSAGAELGHVVIKYDGEPCNCGRRGCFEVYTSATALIRQTKQAAEKNKDSLLNGVIAENDGKINGRTAFLAADRGDAKAKEVIDKYLGYLGVGIVDFINIFRPQVIIIGGGISNEGDKILKPLNDYVSNNCYGGAKTPLPRVVRAKLAGDAGIIGAAALK
ncbi:MAG: ROK family protein [Oscillospiraceae bacterium]|nr:ROK family protein [Oscillospiraceae bacterium]